MSKILNIKESEAENFYIVHDVLPLYYKNKYHRNSLITEQIVAKHLEVFCKENKLNPGNIYIVEYHEGGYYLCCDGFQYNTNDPSVEFRDYCESLGLELDGRKHNPDGEWE